MKKNNIVLIGMPASGKSTVGVILAKMLGKGFIDTDLVIQHRENALLCDIIESRGIDGFMDCEKEAVLSVGVENAVIATGGSVVYSDEAMKHLSEKGSIIYLEVPKNELFKRLRNVKERGVVLRKGETLDDMYESRRILYEKYADMIVCEGSSDIEGTIENILKQLKTC